jgi:hypothetical protein
VLLHAAPASAPQARPTVVHRAAAPAPRPAAPAPRFDFAVHTELPIGRYLQAGEYVWADDGVPAGRTNIVVNLRAQTLSVYRSGYEIGRARIIYGADRKPTPTGTFPILQKDARHFSNLYGGAPMPYMLRLTMDGVAIHASEIADDLVTHGCVGLPKPFAAELFAAARVGDRVIIWRG